MEILTGSQGSKTEEDVVENIQRGTYNIPYLGPPSKEPYTFTKMKYLQ